ncbi:MAG: pentapeptide repeat-containing protein, partial [Ktedonobacterales bacterium]|nr:pentapeptide repeat-containing protein [Ktedonobacterales bacterium]
DQAHLEGASLDQAHLEGASLDQAHLEGAVLRAAHLEGASLRAAHLERADLREVFFDVSTSLREVTITDAKHGGARMADVRWQGVNLAIVQAWPDDLVLGDERAARELVTAPLTRSRSDREPLPKDASREDRRQAERQRRDNLLAAWRGATRANRQLSTTMRDQGMNDEADRLSYRGQLCQRELLRLQGKRGRAWLSRFLDLIAGYGYLPQRSFYAYLLVILGFASAYFALGQALGPRLTPFGALVFSMTSFHGRGFFPGGLILDNPLTGLAAFEALFGLIIEVSFIATFTQRFFGK